MFYERLFFQMDLSAEGVVDNAQMKRFLAYANLEMDAHARNDALAKADVTGDGKMVRWEFVLLCLDTLSAVPISELEIALTNYVAAASAHERKNEARWKAAAKAIDVHARLLLPLAYLIFVVVHYNTQYHDYYASDPTRPMFRNFGDSSMDARGIGLSLIVPSIFVLVLLSWWQARAYARRARLLDEGPSSEEILAKKKSSFGSKASSTKALHAKAKVAPSPRAAVAADAASSASPHRPPAKGGLTRYSPPQVLPRHTSRTNE